MNQVHGYEVLWLVASELQPHGILSREGFLRSTFYLRCKLKRQRRRDPQAGAPSLSLFPSPLPPEVFMLWGLWEKGALRGSRWDRTAGFQVPCQQVERLGAGKFLAAAPPPIIRALGMEKWPRLVGQHRPRAAFTWLPLSHFKCKCARWEDKLEGGVSET